MTPPKVSDPDVGWFAWLCGWLGQTLGGLLGHAVAWLWGLINVIGRFLLGDWWDKMLYVGATVIVIFLLALTSAVASALWWFALSAWAVARRFGRAARSFILGLSTAQEVDHVLSGATPLRLK